MAIVQGNVEMSMRWWTELSPFDKQTILIVEDDTTLRETLALVLDLEGYPTVEAANGVDALEMTEAVDKLGLIVLDMWLPNLTGWAVLQKLKERQCDYPVLVLTADPAVDAAEAQCLGASGYLRKPFALQDFLASVTDLHPDPPQPLDDAHPRIQRVQ